MSNKLLVKKILENALSYKWSLQGLGMLRLYLNDEVRLHVWNTDFEFPDASTMHTHPWHFESEVIVGQLKNILYYPMSDGRLYKRALIKCGEGCEISTPEEILLTAMAPVLYTEGRIYCEAAQDIHSSHPENGTVTIVTRTFLEDRDHAYVFWPADKDWNSAEPRPATDEEVIAITKHSLEVWFK